ncbi:MAG: hypothetical protein ABEJ96_08650, partial [Thiohalorhabdaceae bacterium]
MSREKAMSSPSPRPADWGPFSRAARSLVLRRLAGLQAGRITVAYAVDETASGVAEAAQERTARLTVNRPRFYRRVLTGGSLGAAGAYLDGDWDCDNLVGLFRATLRGLGRDDMEGGSG